MEILPHGPLEAIQLYDGTNPLDVDGGVPAACSSSAFAAFLPMRSSSSSMVESSGIISSDRAIVLVFLCLRPSPPSVRWHHWGHASASCSGQRRENEDLLEEQAERPSAIRLLSHQCYRFGYGVSSSGGSGSGK